MFLQWGPEINGTYAVVVCIPFFCPNELSFQAKKKYRAGVYESVGLIKDVLCMKKKFSPTGQSHGVHLGVVLINVHCGSIQMDQTQSEERVLMYRFTPDPWVLRRMSEHLFNLLGL